MYSQKKLDVISEYEALNEVAEPGGVVLFGSTEASRIPLNELTQDYGIDVPIYNRSIPGLTIEEAEHDIASCITPLRPKAILLHFGEEELLSSAKTVEDMMESYRWLLYQLHTALPKSRLILVSVNEQTPEAKRYNRALKSLAAEYGCEFTDGPSGKLDGTYALRFFHTLRSFLFDRNMTLADALRYYPA
ncbi:hypothetical protein [uncultured Ruminococcus sp.]|uniref:SGNH/GDSL hydrolase family protein n=1 Tax=uncultured Ruminococcus sp. TaxID=165186 RepID=UPI002609A66A|nr:hypothetical protein [uncultured Ruminococcus sp.]